MLAFALGLGACSGSPPPHVATPVADLVPSALQPGDAVRLDVFREAEISREYQLDEHGIAVFPLIGEKNLLGFAADSLRTTLVVAYSKFLRDPSIQVTILRRINILGEVRRPGLYPVDTTMSLADALALAGGLSASGNAKDIRLIRGDQTLQRGLGQAALIGSSPIHSGDQIVVGQRSWLSRNTGVAATLFAAVLTATAVLVR